MSKERFPADDEHQLSQSATHSTIIYNQAIQDCLEVIKTIDIEFKTDAIKRIEQLKKQ